jgi:hypothetical protein
VNRAPGRIKKGRKEGLGTFFLSLSLAAAAAAAGLPIPAFSACLLGYFSILFLSADAAAKRNQASSEL